MLCFLASCDNKEIELVNGTLVNSVSFNIRARDNIDANEQNLIVSKIPLTVQNVSRVPSVAPYRKGFDFSRYYDSQNDYKVGDVFTESTEKDEGGNVNLTIDFEPIGTYYYQDRPMFTLTINEIANTSLKGHVDKGVAEELGDDEISIDFITFPAGYSWVVPNAPGVKDAYEVNSNKYDEIIVGLNKGPNESDFSSWMVEDFAISTTEVPSALFKTILDWNDNENKGYEFGFDRNLNSSLSMNDNEYPYYGVYYNNGKYYNRNSAYDPVCFVPYDSAIVFCNALTEWYNERYGASLTPCYTIDGNAGSTVIKSVFTHSDNIKYINTLSTDSFKDNERKALLPEGTKFIPHVQGATGFRLPTSAEWVFAATIDYNNTDGYNTAHVGSYIYPNMVNPNNVSGATSSDFSGDSSVYTRIVSSDCYGKTSEKSDNGTQQIGVKTVYNNSSSSYAVELPNLGGIYDMSGNVAEWTENLQYGLEPSSLSRVVFGGSFMSSARNNVVSNYKCVKTIFKDKKQEGNETEYLMDVGEEVGSGEEIDNNIGFIGLRLCRTVNSTSVIDL